ncbi:putative glycosidase crf1 [Paramyrothecium foliicola]|nr:putative glycosidase crf1 [Paramyrothecium foliicola]
MLPKDSPNLNLPIYDSDSISQQIQTPLHSHSTATMFSKSIVLALAAASMVSAQTHTDCNPLEKTCPANPALGNEKVFCDLTKGECGAFKELDGTDLTYNERGAVFSIEKDTNAPTIHSDKFIFFGRLDVEVQAAAGAGIVTSLVLQSQDLDEIDWEWVGGDDEQVQTNYFYKGDTTTYDRGAFHPVHQSLTTYHKYSIEYTKKAVTWFVDDAVVRTLTYEEANGGKHFPQTPMQIRLGTWVAGRKGAPQGTVEWAGGLADFSKAPFNAYYKSIAITDYAGGDAPTTESIKEYLYGDHSGTWESIKIIKGDGSSEDNKDDEEKTSSAKPSAKPTTSAEEKESKTSKAAESTKTSSAEEEKETTSAEEKTTSKAAPSTTLATISSTPAGTPGASTTAAPTSSGTAPPANEATEAPPSAANSLSLGSALLVGAGLFAAQLLL